MTTTFGMMIGVLAMWGFNWLHNWLERIGTQMRVAQLELVTYLNVARRGEGRRASESSLGVERQRGG